MAGRLRRKQIEFTGEMNVNVSKFLPLENEVILLINADTDKLGTVRKRLGNTKPKDTLASSTSTTTTITTTSSSTTSTSTS